MTQTPRIILGLAFLGLSLAAAKAADAIGVFPITEKILAVQIRDGHTDYEDNSRQEVKDAIQYTTGLLNEALADDETGFSLISTDHAAYTSATPPGAGGRRSRPYQVHSPNSWDRVALAPHWALREHWIYLEFPTPLQEGKTYTLNLPSGLVSNGNAWTFKFEAAKIESPSIAVGQAGFTPSAPKFAIIGHWMGSFSTPVHAAGGLELGAVGADGATATGANYTSAAFQVVNVDTGAVAFNGTLTFRRDKTYVESNASVSTSPTYSNCDTWQADFSGLTTPGRYRVVVPRMGCSVPFEIKAGAYRDVFRTAMKGFFNQRSGIVKEVYPGVVIPRAHHSDDPLIKFYYDPNHKFWLNPSGGSSVNTSTFDFVTRPLNPALGKFYGWYYDAGDWDAYQNDHLKVPLALLVTYAMWPTKFRDGDVGNRYKLSASDPEWIDEGANGLPDILDEGRWVLDRNRQWRDVLIANGYGTGGVPGYIGRDAGVSGPPWVDARPQAVTAQDPLATYAVAGGLGLLAHCLNIHHQQTNPGQNHPEFTQLRDEAIAAYNWANAYLAANPTESNKKTLEAKMTAAAGLYLATANATYNTDFKALYNNPGAFDSLFSSYWMSPGMGQLGELIYAVTPATHPGYDTAIRSGIVTRKTNAANSELLDTMNTHGYRGPLAKNRWFPQGLMTTPSPLAAVAHYLSPSNGNYPNVVHAQIAYHLGGNEMGVSHLTGVGQRREIHPFIPMEWALFNSDSMAYRYRNLPGFSVYFRGTFDVSGIGSESANYALFYPPLTSSWTDPAWPFAQKRSSSRQSIAGSEFTVWENLPANAMVYGALLDAADPVLPKRLPPDVRLNIPDGSTLPIGTSTPLTASGSPLLDRVEYFYNWQFIGASTDRADNFRVMLDPARFGVVEGQTAKIIAIGYDIHGDFSWETPDVESTVTFQTMTVVPATSVTITGAPSAAVPVNRAHQLNATVAPANATFPFLVWTSSNPSVAAVDHTGLVRAMGQGSAVITARTADGVASAQVTINTVYKPLTALTIPNVPADIGLFASHQLEVVKTPADTSDLELAWSSSSPGIIRVDANGRLTGLADGAAVITVSGGSVSASTAPIVVTYKPLVSLAITGAPEVLGMGAAAVLGLVENPVDASESDFVWTSSNPDVATVSATGLITGVRPGTTLVSVRGATENVSSTVAVTVGDSLRDGLLHFWAFNDSNVDSIGGRTAPLSTGAAYDAAVKREGTHSLLRGTNTSWPSGINLGPLYSGSGGATYIVWARNPLTQINQNNLLASGGSNNFVLYVNSWNTTDGRLRLITKDANGNTDSTTPAGTFPADQWTQVALVATQGQPTATVYVNKTPYVLNVRPEASLGGNFTLGASAANHSYGIWPGHLDAVRVYNRALGAAEIAALADNPDLPPADTTPPPAPSGLGAVSGAAGIELTWGASGAADLAAYRIFRGTAAGGPYALVGTVGPAQTAFTDAEAFGQVYFVVRALDAAGNLSPPSNEAGAIGNPPTVPPLALGMVPSVPSTAGAAFEILVTFNRSITGLTAGSFNVTNGSITQLQGSGSRYALTVQPSGAGNVTVSLPAGAVQDELGRGNLAASVTIPLAVAPVLNIISPAAGAVFTLGSAVPLSGSATDGAANISASIQWSSSINGPLGTGSSLSATNLSAGAHVITATATGSTGLGSTATRLIYINTAPSLGFVTPGATSVNLQPWVKLWLAAQGQDDGYPLTPGSLSYTWTKQSGPGTVAFTAANTAETGASFSANGTYMLRVTASDGALSTSSDLTVKVGGASLYTGNIGSPATAGSIAESGGTWTIKGAGSGFRSAATSDQGYFVYIPVAAGAAVDMRVRITSQQATGNEAQAGVMLRDTVNANSVAVAALRRSQQSRALANRRTTTGGAVTQTQGNPNSAPVNGYLRLQRGTSSNGTHSYTLSRSTDGTNWTTITGAFNVTTSGEDYVGFWVSSATSATSTVTFGAVTGFDAALNFAPLTVVGTAPAPFAPGASANITGTITDDGFPNPPAATTAEWRKVSGPGTVTFGDNTATSTTVTASAPGTYTVRLIGNDSSAATYDDLNLTVSNPVQAPSGLTASAQSTSSILLTWTDNNTVESGYRIERSLSGTGGFTAITTTAANATTHTDTGLQPGITYYYRIIAESSFGDSASSAVASASTPAPGNQTLVNDTLPSASDWIMIHHANLGAAGYNLNPTLTGGAALRFSTSTYTNNTGATDHLFDNTYVMRALGQDVALGIGDRITMQFKVTAPSSPSGNQARGTRSISFRMIGRGNETLPTLSSTFGTAGAAAVVNDLDYTLAGSSAINLGMSVSPGNTQLSVIGNTTTANSGSTRLFSSGGATFVTASPPNLVTAWTGDSVSFEVKRIADSSGYPVYELRALLYAPDGSVQHEILNQTTSASSSANFGTATSPANFSHIAIGVGASGQINAAAIGYVDFTLDDVRVDLTRAAVPLPDVTGPVTSNITGPYIIGTSAVFGWTSLPPDSQGASPHYQVEVNATSGPASATVQTNSYTHVITADTPVSVRVRAVNPSDASLASAWTAWTATKHILTPDGDFDGDGFGNQQEHDAGGDPLTPKAFATVTLAGLVQAYNDTPRPATAVTDPPGLTVQLSYNASPLPPTNPGAFTLVGTVSDVAYRGSATNTLVITGPVPADDSITNSGTAFFKIPLADLLANDSRIDNTGASVSGGISVTGVTSGPGNTATLSGAFVLFTPSAGGTDTFTYQASDGTSSRNATVTVLAGPPSGPPPFDLDSTMLGTASYDGVSTSVTHHFSGVPGETYTIEYTGELNQPWTALPPVTAGPTGLFSVTITAPGDHTADWNGSMFFRATRVAQ